MGEQKVQAVIVEDDLMVASINRQYLTQIHNINVKAVFHNGKEAWEYLSKETADLIILDEYMPGMTGMELLTGIRAAGLPFDVIMVTAANDSAHLDQAMRLGVLDYLVKPFSYQRFQDAVSKYLSKRQLLQEREHFSQSSIDMMLGQERVSRTQTLSKGLQDKTLSLIRELLNEHKNSFLTCEEIAGMCSLSRVTVRRYMNYLIELNEVISEVDYQTGGRPSVKYRLIHLIS